MIKNRLIAFLFVTLVSFPVLAQQKKPALHSINTVGISAGQHGTDFLWQTVNGLVFNKWFAGIGAGGDYYGYKSYPVFIDARMYFGKDSRGFSYGDLGYNVSGKNKPGEEVYYNTFYHFFGGVYTDIGIGYKIKLAGRSFFVISTGYSYKEINNRVGITAQCLVAPCGVDYSTYKYGNGRVVLKAGVDF